MLRSIVFGSLYLPSFLANVHISALTDYETDKLKKTSQPRKGVGSLFREEG